MASTIAAKNGKIVLITAAHEQVIDENWTTAKKAEHAANVAALTSQRDFHQTNVDLCQARLNALASDGAELDVLDQQSRKIKAPTLTEPGDTSDEKPVKQ